MVILGAMHKHINFLWPPAEHGGMESLPNYFRMQGCKFYTTPSDEARAYGVRPCGELIRPRKGAKAVRLASMSHKRRADAAARIRPAFKISFEERHPPVGVHIRRYRTSTQAELQRHGRLRNPRVRMDSTWPDEAERALALTFRALQQMRPASVFVASDSPTGLAKFKERLLASGIPLATPRVEASGVPPVVSDFFALSMCSEIFMVSAFSSFSTMAALVGDVPLWTLLPANFTDQFTFGARTRPIPTGYAWESG